MGGSCILIDHDDDLPIDNLVERIHGRLHGVVKVEDHQEHVEECVAPAMESPRRRVSAG